jgi:hypothetical protein
MRNPLEGSQLLQLVRLFTLLRKTRVNHMILREDKVVEEDVDVEEIFSKGGEVDTTKAIDPIFIVPLAKRMGHMKQMTVSSMGQDQRRHQTEERGQR